MGRGGGLRRLVGLLIGGVVMAMTVAGPALADDEGADAYVDPDGNPRVDVEDVDVDPGGGDDEAGGDDCIWRVAVEDDFATGIYDVDGSRLYSETGRWFERVCDGRIVAVGGSGIVPEGGAVDPRELAASASAAILIEDPPMQTSPSADERLYTQVQTWLWVDQDWWRTYTATASAGRVSATATAFPTLASWSMGDGGTEECAGPGVEWRRGMPDSATDCAYTYRQSSANQPQGTYAVEVVVDFEVTWTSNTGQGGQLVGVTRTASQDVEVGQIQAVESE